MITAVLADRALLSDRDVRDALQAGGVRLLAAYTPDELLLRHAQDRPDVAAVRVGPHERSAWALVQQLQSSHPTPVVLLADPPRQHLAARALGLSGTTLVLTPCAPPVLLAALLDAARAAGWEPPDGPAGSREDLHAGPLHSGAGQPAVTLAGRDLALSPAQSRLLRVLLSRAGQIVSAAELARQVWGSAARADVGAVEAAVQALRQRLGEHADLLRTVRGQGYMLDVPLPTPAASRRNHPLARLGVLTVDLQTGQARVAGRLLVLPAREGQVLLELARQSGACVPVEQLRAVIWPDQNVTTNTIRTIVMRLRRQLAALPQRPRPVVHTVRHQGYLLTLDDDQDAGPPS